MGSFSSFGNIVCASESALGHTGQQLLAEWLAGRLLDHEGGDDVVGVRVRVLRSGLEQEQACRQRARAGQSEAGARASDAATAVPNSLVLLKSGMPLVWARSWARVILDHAAGRLGTRAPIVSSSASTPSATAESVDRAADMPSRRSPLACDRQSSAPLRSTRSALPTDVGNRLVTALDDGHDGRRSGRQRDDLLERGVQRSISRCGF